MDNLSVITIYTHGHGVPVRVRVEKFCQEADRGKEIMARQGEQAGKKSKINVCNTTQCNNNKIQKNSGKKILKNMQQIRKSPNSIIQKGTKGACKDRQRKNNKTNKPKSFLANSPKHKNKRLLPFSAFKMKFSLVKISF